MQSVFVPWKRRKTCAMLLRDSSATTLCFLGRSWEVPEWRRIPDLVDVHEIHIDSFKSFRSSTPENFAETSHKAGGHKQSAEA